MIFIFTPFNAIASNCFYFFFNKWTEINKERVKKSKGDEKQILLYNLVKIG